MAMNRFFCLEITEKNQFPIHESQNRPNSSSEFFFPFHSFFALERRGDSTHMSLSLLFMGGRELICHCSDLGRTFGAVFASYLISRERGGANLDGVSQSRAISVAKKNSEATPAPKCSYPASRRRRARLKRIRPRFSDSLPTRASWGKYHTGLVKGGLHI